jgi:hypothetical protein
MSDSKTKSEATTKISFQEIALIRAVEYRIGKKRYIFWHGGGSVFNGRCSHMHALRAAREASGFVTTNDRKFNERAKV